MSETPLDPRKSSVVQSVDRALTIMEILARDDWSGVTEIAKELGIHKSTVFRLVSTLERRGFVEQHTQTQKYRLGFAVVRLANGVRAELDLAQLARPVCERLSEHTGETVNLAVLEGGDVVNVDQVNLSSQTVSVNWLGRRSALHATSTGKVFLAAMPPQDLDTYIARGLSRNTPHTITDPENLRAHLSEVRRLGFGTGFEELEEGLNAVAAPVRGADGQLVAALCVSAPSYRLTSGDVEEVGKLVSAGALEVSRRLGFVGETVAGEH